MRKRPNTTDELVDIYTLLRLVDSSADQGDDTNSPGQSGKLESVFPKQFINKVLNEHILDVKELSNEICNQIFSLPRRDDRIDKQPEHLARVEEYFHFCLHQLYDFYTNIDWYDNEVFVIKDLNDQKYGEFREFLIFRHRLDEITTLMRGPHQRSEIKRESSLSSPLESKVQKSNLRSLGSANSPRDRRRVRFSKAERPMATTKQPIWTQRDHKEVQILFALDLQIYGINLFFHQLCANLWTIINADVIRDNLRQVIDSKIKIRTSQLYELAKDVRAINRLFLITLDCLNISKELYLIGHLSEIVSFEYPRTLKYKLGRIQSYCRWVDKEMESAIILRMAQHLMQIIFELITSEISSPPLELNAKTSLKTKPELRRSQENLSNFISGWLGLDDNVKQSDTTRRTKVSTIAEGVEYNSSSQIMDQMENLHRMVVDLVSNLITQMFQDRQRKYLLNLAYFGLSKYYADVSADLSQQLAKSRELMKSQSEEDKITGNIDSIAAKIRCLKFVHIMTNLERLVQDLASSYKIELFDTDLHRKISSFVDNMIGQERPTGHKTGKRST